MADTACNEPMHEQAAAPAPQEPAPQTQRRRFVGRGKAAEGGDSSALGESHYWVCKRAGGAAAVVPRVSILPFARLPEAHRLGAGVRMQAQIPDDILGDERLNAAISTLPANYNFEVHKTIWRIRSLGAKKGALSCPALVACCPTHSQSITPPHATPQSRPPVP
jgi:2-(3-amino-3-carboxypropyl)histidine synthase